MREQVRCGETSGAAEHSYSNPSASCQAQSEGAAVWGSFLRHQFGSVEGLAEFVYSFVYGSSRFSDVHEEVFSGWPDAVEAGGFGDFPEGVFVCGERDPGGPGEGEPGFGEVFHLSSSEQMELSRFCGIDPLILEDNGILLGLCNKFENITGIYFESFYNFRRDCEIERVAPMVKPGLHGIFHFSHSFRSMNAHLALNAHYVH